MCETGRDGRDGEVVHRRVAVTELCVAVECVFSAVAYATDDIHIDRLVVYVVDEFTGLYQPQVAYEETEEHSGDNDGAE